MEFGFNVPNSGILANPGDIKTISQRGEELGFTILAIPDHIVFPRSISSRYPYSADGAFTFAPNFEGDFLEPLALMAHLAAITTKARILTSVMVVPYRDPILTAKLVSTIDVMSGGRVTLGCGAGWMEEEFVAVNAPPFKERGKVTDEYIKAFRELWSADNPTFKGDYTEFSDIFFAPKPVQSPHPPIWIGGESMPAIRRTARLGDAWYPIGCNPHHPLDTIEKFSARLDTLKAEAEKIDRDPATIDLAFWAVWFGGDTPTMLESGERMVLTGSAEDIAGDIKAFEALGVRHVLFNFLGATLEDSLANMEGFAADVMPLVR
ncbi:MAG: Pyrimidine monooxygenase RutA [Alphaproteobacteria bacterium MarineAlpha10_Bin2]|nr:MAG: Pyrimidine monooxygenase RutA [Alphaproteobacteria bacterium MarineAlpha10_Bin2]